MTVRHDELVVLVDEQGRAIGFLPKAQVHGTETPLHRAFSCYVFDAAGRLLVTRRALGKATFPGLWTNSVCGHPAPGERDVDAIARRAVDELGIEVEDVVLALPDFRYRASFDGIVENEICPVYLARSSSTVVPNPDEVVEHRWVGWEDLLRWVAADEGAFSYWSRLQVGQLSAGPALGAYTA